MQKRDLISITDLNAKELLLVLSIAQKYKEKTNKHKYSAILQSRTLAMIFEKPSLRTRLSFEIGMTQLGGHAIYLGPSDIGLGKRESISDVASVTSRMADIIMARTFAHKTVKEFAENSLVPVINGLSDLEHPCQTLADILTIYEIKKQLKGLKIAFIGDGENNVPHSLALGCALLGINFVCAAPKKYQMNKIIMDKAINLAKNTQAKIVQTQDPEKAAKEADVIYTDTWISMGDESEKDARIKIFSPYRITTNIMRLANKYAIFMHDLPAYRGNEVTPEVIDGKQSVVFRQAENRLHAQKALMLFLLGLE